MTKKPEELKPCPFGCGLEMKYGGVPQRGLWPEDRFRLHCKCGAVGPWAATPEEAAIAWNRRASPSSEGTREREAIELLKEARDQAQPINDDLPSEYLKRLDEFLKGDAT
jgi:hypothetical protein